MLLDATTWTTEDSRALADVFDLAGKLFTMDFQVLGFTTNLFSLIVTGFVLVFIFKLVRSLVNSN